MTRRPRRHLLGQRPARQPRRRVRLRGRRQRRRRQHRRRRAGRAWRARRHRRGGRALLAPRLQHAGGVGLPEPVPGARQPRDRGPVDHDPAGALRRRRHHRQLDVVISHARRDAGALGAAPRRGRPRRGGAGAPLRGRRAAAVDRARRRGRRQPQQPQAVGRRHQARLEARADPPQRQGLRAARLLRHGLPARRQAVGADHLRARRDGRRRRSVHRLPRALDRDRQPARARRRRRRARPRARSSDRAARGAARQARRGAGGRRDQHAGAAAALAHRQQQRPGRAPHLPAPDGAGDRLLRRAGRVVLRPAAVGRLPSLRRSRRAHRLLLRDGADPPDAGGAGAVGVRQRAPSRHGTAAPTRRRRSRC